jgi:hypothetical protein
MLSFSDSKVSSDESSEASPVASEDKGKDVVAPTCEGGRRRPRNSEVASWLTPVATHLCTPVATAHLRWTQGGTFFTGRATTYPRRALVWTLRASRSSRVAVAGIARSALRCHPAAPFRLL